MAQVVWLGRNFGGRLVLFYIRQVNRVNYSGNGCVIDDSTLNIDLVTLRNRVN